MTTLHYWLALFHLQNIGLRTIHRWHSSFPDITNLFTATNEEREAKGISPEQNEALHTINMKLIETDLEWLQQQSHHHIVTFDDPAYPTLLREIYDPPILLFIRGNKNLLSNKQIAIVGARNATVAGLKNAEFFAHQLVQAGYVITSGLALGIDGAAHRGALAGQGKTIAVCGTGLHETYPKSHRKLAEQMIAQDNAIISEFPLNTLPRAENFPRRNRVISGMSKGVLLVEALVRSGSLITARHAMEQGREVFAIPGSIHNPLTRGCHHLIRQGAKLVESVEDILEEFADHARINAAETRAELSAIEKKLLEEIGYEITPMDMILLRSGLTAGEVSSMLLRLELKGYIQSVSGGYIRELT